MRYTYCSLCHKKVPVEEVRYNKDAKLVCKDCYKNPSVKLTGSPIEELPLEEENKMEKTNYNKYICVNCRYNFKVKEGTSKTIRCPYCGSTDVMLYNYSTDDLIREASDSRYDY